MAAGITDQGWTMHALLSFHGPLSRWAPPKRRGRPSRTLQRLIARWCSWPRFTVEPPHRENPLGQLQERLRRGCVVLQEQVETAGQLLAE